VIAYHCYVDNTEITVTTERFQVPEVSCQHCVNAITKEVSAIPGVQRVQVALDDKTVTVEHSEQVQTAAIIAAINEAGYDEVAPLN
jgi:copper ion binding protein